MWDLQHSVGPINNVGPKHSAVAQIMWDLQHTARPTNNVGASAQFGCINNVGSIA